MDDNVVTNPHLMYLMACVAEELSNIDGNSWEVNAFYAHAVSMKRADGVSLFVICERLDYLTETLKGKRLEISGSYPRNLFGRHYSETIPMGESLPKITLSATRTAAAIANDIQRRILPDVIEHTKKAREWVKRDQDRNDSQETILAAVIKAGDGERTTRWANDNYRASAIDYKDPSWEAVVTYDEKVDLKITGLTQNEAVSVLRFVKGFGDES